MHRFLSIDGKIVPALDAGGFMPSPALFYGKGIFTTIAIRGGEPFLWEKHWQRLSSNARKIGLDLSRYSDDGLRTSLGALVTENRVHNGRARITILDESDDGLWKIGDRRGSVLHIVTGVVRPVPQPFRLTVSPFRVNTASPLSGIKSCSYLENILAIEEARSRGFNEAIRLNERGDVSSACLANVFWLKDGRLFTPTRETGCLEGTLRAFVLESMECTEIASELEDLRVADAVFLTSAGIGIVQADEFDGRQLKARLHEITRVLPW
jgi:branched-chain amino acid aminotransferase